MWSSGESRYSEGQGASQKALEEEEKGRKKISKAVDTTASVLDGWAGAEKVNKQLCDGWTVLPTEISRQKKDI